MRKYVQGDNRYAETGYYNDYFDEGTPKCNLFVYDMLTQNWMSPGIPNGGGWFTDPYLPPMTKEWANPNYKIPGWIVVSSPQAGDVVAIRGAKYGHTAVMISSTYSVYAGFNGLSFSNFGSSDSYFKNYPGNNGYVYRRYVGGQ